MSYEKLVKFITVLQSVSGGGVISALWFTGSLEFWLTIFVLSVSIERYIGVRND